MTDSVVTIASLFLTNLEKISQDMFLTRFI